MTVLCEPQLGKYGLYESGIKGSSEYTRKIKDFLTYCNGGNDLLWISEKINSPFRDRETSGFSEVSNLYVIVCHFPIKSLIFTSPAFGCLEE